MNRLERKLSRGQPKIIHGGYSFIATGKLPAHRAYLLRYLSNCRAGLIHDLGGEDNLSTAQMILIDRVVSKLGLIRCVEEHTRQNGAIIGQELSPILKASYLAYSNSLRLDLLALGLEQKATDRSLSPLEYIKEFDQAKEKEKT